MSLYIHFCIYEGYILKIYQHKMSKSLCHGGLFKFRGQKIPSKSEFFATQIHNKYFLTPYYLPLFMGIVESNYKF